jgi:hypothetical protein
MTIGNYHPFIFLYYVLSTTSAFYDHRKLPPLYFHILGVLYDVRVL